MCVYGHTTIVVLIHVHTLLHFLFLVDTIGTFFKFHFQKLDKIILNTDIYLAVPLFGPGVGLVSPSLTSFANLD